MTNNTKPRNHMNCLDELIAAKIEYARAYDAWLSTIPNMPLEYWTSRDGMKYELRVTQATVDYDKYLRNMIKQMVQDGIDCLNRPD